MNFNNKMKYNYLIGGITITSDIFYPELLLSEHTPQVELSYGEVPDHLKEKNVDFPFIEANKNQYLLKLNEIGSYLVENGNKITIQKHEKATPHDLEKYVLTNIFGALSYQRNSIPMHGGVFIHEGKGILISGLSGNGKSSILTALYQKGYKLISDDITNLEVIENKVIAHPCFPRILLWKDTAEKLNIDLSSEKKLRSDMEKYLFPIDEKPLKNTIELKKIIVLTNSEIKEQNIEVKGLGKIESLRKNTFKPWMVKSFEKQKEHFLQLSKIANLVDLEVFQNDHKVGIEKSVNLFIEKLDSNVK